MTRWVRFVSGGSRHYTNPAARAARCSTKPTPGELWDRYRAGQNLSGPAAQALLIPYQLDAGRTPRYYQRVAITRAVEAILAGRYFGDPLTVYSLRQGIEDGFLAPYRVHRVVTTLDAAGWRPAKGQLDKSGLPIPDDVYLTKDFERTVSLQGRTEAIAGHLSDHLRKTDRYGKTIVVCVDQEHADQMRRALSNLNPDLAQETAALGTVYAVRVTSDEGQIGRGFLSQFQDVDTKFPVILTNSQLLTTGVDAETVKNVALVRVVGAMSEFKQIIGRGTRVREGGRRSFGSPPPRSSTSSAPTPAAYSTIYSCNTPSTAHASSISCRRR